MSRVSLAPSCWNFAQCSNFKVLFFVIGIHRTPYICLVCPKLKKRIIAHRGPNVCLERTGPTMQHGGMEQTNTFFCLFSLKYKRQGSLRYQQVNTWLMLSIHSHIIKQDILHRWIYARDPDKTEPDIDETVPKVAGSNTQGPVQPLRHVRGSRETLVVRRSFSLAFGKTPLLAYTQQHTDSKLYQCITYAPLCIRTFGLASCSKPWHFV